MRQMLPGSRLQHFLPAALAAAAVAAALALVIWLLSRWLHRAAAGRPGARQLIRTLARTLEAAGVLVVALIAFRGAGLGQPRLSWQQLSDWVMGPGLRILFIFVGAYILVRIVEFFISHLQAVLLSGGEEGPDAVERRKRIDTLGRLLRALSLVLVLGMAFLMALREVNIDITPVLTGAGVLGVAIGFGAQTVVKDVIAGAFLILENQIRVGDVVTINGKTGLVETIRLRILVLRALDGTVYIFQNGAVSEIANLTKDFAYAVLNLSLASREDLDRVSRVLDEIGREMRADPAFGPRILGPLEILGVDSLAGAAFGLKARMKTLPMQQWAVDRELLRRIKVRFAQEQIALA